MDDNTEVMQFCVLLLIVTRQAGCTCGFLFAGQKDGGTQIKLIVDYPHSMQALFKPMRSVNITTGGVTS